MHDGPRATKAPEQPGDREAEQRVHEAYAEAQLLPASERPASRDAQLAMAGNWKDEQLPALQRHVADVQLENLRNGIVSPVFAALGEALGAIDSPRFSLLDSACATGYYGEVLRAIDPRPIAYAGSDYSPAMVASARAHYPEIAFEVQDVTAMTFGDRSFDVVLLSGVLEHVPEYRRAIAEACRVARTHVIVHRCPLTNLPDHERTIGTQYSIETPRTFFAASVLASEFAAEGFSLVRSVDLGEDPPGRLRRLRIRVSRWFRAPHDPPRSAATMVFGRES